MNAFTDKEDSTTSLLDVRAPASRNIHCHAQNSNDLLPVVLTFGVGMGALMFGYNVGAASNYTCV